MIEDMNKKQCWVIFSGHTDMMWLKFLKPGFRHCAILINDGERWMTIDPLSNFMDVTVHQVPPSFDLPQWMEARGYKTLRAEQKRPLKPAPIALFTCVEAVKRTLGIHNRLIITPWQLYKTLHPYQKSKKEFGLFQKAQQWMSKILSHPFTDKGDLSWEV